MKTKDGFLQVVVIWDMLLMGCPYEIISETQRVGVDTIKMLEGFLSVYSLYRKAARKGEFDKLVGYHAQIAGISGLIQCCA